MTAAVPTNYVNPTGLQNVMTSVCKWLETNIPASGFTYQFLSQLQGIKPPYVSVTDFGIQQPGNTAYGKEINPGAPDGQQQTGREAYGMLEINIATDISVTPNAVKNLRQIRDRLIYGLTNAGVPNDADGSIPVPAINLVNYQAVGQPIVQESISQAASSDAVFSFAHQTLTTSTGAIVVQVVATGSDPLTVTYNGIPLVKEVAQGDASLCLSMWVLLEPPTGNFDVEINTGIFPGAYAVATGYKNVSDSGIGSGFGPSALNPVTISFSTSGIDSRICVLAAQDLPASTPIPTGYTSSANGTIGGISGQSGFVTASQIDDYFVTAFFPAGNSQQSIQILELLQNAAPQPTGIIITVPGEDNAIISRYYPPNEEEPNVHRYQLLVKICWFEMAN